MNFKIIIDMIIETFN